MNGIPSWWAVLLALWLGGCGSAALVPEDRFYRLGAADPGRLVSSPVLAEVAVEPFRGDAVYGERAILHADGDAPLELRRHHYHFWAAPPPRLVAARIGRCLEAAGVVGRAETGGAGIRYRIRGELTRFEKIHGENGATVHVGLRLRLQDDETGRVLLSRHFEESRGPFPDMYRTVEGFGDAVVSICRSFGRDLSALSGLQ